MGLVGIAFKDELAEALFHKSHIHVVLSTNLDGHFFQLIAVKLALDNLNVLHNLFDALFLGNVEVDELIRNDSQTLQGKSLNFSSGETLNDP
jgi:hypothetical protein